MGRSATEKKIGKVEFLVKVIKNVNVNVVYLYGLRCKVGGSDGYN